MIVVDASALYESLTNGPHAHDVRRVLLSEEEQAAPYVIDAEITGLLRRDLLMGALDTTTCTLALHELMDWPGERIPTDPFLERVWDLRATVRTWDAFYVALAEVLDCPLVTLDARLTRATGPRCTFTLIG